MVLLTMTASMVDSLNCLEPPSVQDTKATKSESEHEVEEGEKQQTSSTEPSLLDPKIGNPISHAQIISLSHRLKSQSSEPPKSLEELLRGSTVYIPPPPPKPEPTPEFKALMARLRRDEEARAYERMVNPPPAHETFSSHFSSHFPPSAASFAAANAASPTDLGDSSIMMNDVHRQITLIINVLVSIVGVAVTLWIASRWWSLPARLFLSMGGAGLVAVAEVVVYQVYVWRMEGKKEREEKRELELEKERRAKGEEVLRSWEVGEGKEDVVRVDDGEKKGDLEMDGEAAMRKRQPVMKGDGS